MSFETAFPINYGPVSSGAISSGLTKREYFAARAMQSLVLNLNDEHTLMATTEIALERGVAVSELVARQSVNFADALLKVLSE